MQSREPSGSKSNHDTSDHVGDHSSKKNSGSIAIIGAGIVGTSAAYYLARLGWDPIVIDAGGIGDQASTQNAGGLHFQLSHHVLTGDEDVLNRHLSIIPMNADAQERWPQAVRELGGDLELTMDGGLVAAETDDEVEMLRVKVDRERKAGFDTEYLQGEELTSIAPELAGHILAAARHPLEGGANARQATALFAQRSRDFGSRYVLRNAVTDLKREGTTWKVKLTDGPPVHVDAVLIAAGAWSAHILSMTGLSIPMQLRGLNMCVTTKVAPLMSHLVMHVRRPLSVKQVASGNVIIGGGRPTQLVRRNSALRWEALPSPEVILANALDAVEVVNGLENVQVIRSWQGILGTPGDGMPLVGSIPGRPGLFLAVGGHTGYTIGPTSGALIAELIDGRQPSIDLTPFLPERLMGKL